LWRKWRSSLNLWRTVDSLTGLDHVVAVLIEREVAETQDGVPRPPLQHSMQCAHVEPMSSAGHRNQLPDVRVAVRNEKSRTALVRALMAVFRRMVRRSGG